MVNRGEIIICTPERDEEKLQQALAHAAVRFERPETLLDALRRPPSPELVIVKAEHAVEFTPARLERLRRNGSRELRRLPVLVLGVEGPDAAEWSHAGAYVFKGRLSERSILAAIEDMREANRRWIDSPVYVGPDRRRKHAMFNLAQRRLSDSPLLARRDPRPTRAQPAVVDHGQSLNTVVRRLRIASQSVALSERDGRARFLSEVSAARSQALLAARPSLTRCLSELEDVLERAGATGAIDADRVETLLVEAMADVAP
jgi:hypothetical protein